MTKLILFDDSNQMLLSKSNDFLDLDYLRDVLDLNFDINSDLVNLRLVDDSLDIDFDYYTATLPKEYLLNRTDSLSEIINISSIRSVLLNSEINKDHRKIKIITRARQLAIWDNDHRYCGRCGNKTKFIAHENAKECIACGFLSYPRISPCIVVAVIRDNKMLLGRSPHFPAGVYSLLAGFIETAETCEQAVIREVYEETRIKVDNIRYFGSQPWPFPHSLMLAYIADYVDGEIIVDTNELEDARWFSFDNLRTCPDLLPAKGSLSRMLLDHLIKATA